VSYEFVKIASPIEGAEGPVFDHWGRFFVVEPGKGRVLEILSDGALREHANTDGIPAGLAVDPHNNLWAADMRKGILRIDPHGASQQVVSEWEGIPIRGCNDLSFASSGDLYFTAPAGSSDQVPAGELFCRRSDGELICLDGGFAFCNGIALSIDDSMLIVAETFTKKLWAYDLNREGSQSKKRHWATLTGAHRGGPDGIDFDIEGNLLAANWGGGAIEVFDSKGKLLERIQTPFAAPSNLHFGGADGRDLFITEHTNNAVWKTRWRYRGLLAPPQQKDLR
jgi:gluconolactonase